MRRLIRPLAAALLFGVLIGPGQAAAQDAPRDAPQDAPQQASRAPSAIAVGQTLEGRLDASSPRDADGAPFDAYRFSARAGERLALRLTSDDLDPVLAVGADGAVFEALATNDDAPGQGLNAGLVFTAPGDGDYLIRAGALGEGVKGAYVLVLAAAPPPLEPRAIAMGDTVEGALTADDALGDSGQRADAYVFNGQAGRRIVATLSATDFDAYLEVFAADGEARESLAQDDDGAGEGTNARLDVTLPADGRYVIEARALSPDAEGDYELTLEERAPPPEPAAIAFGQTVEGEIVEGDATGEADQLFDAYRFSGQAGRRVRIELRSGDFDAYVELGLDEETFLPLAQDDDGLMEGFDSRLDFTLPETGDYVIRAAPLGGTTTGLYALSLADRGPEPTPGSLLMGATARGTLGDGDAADEAGSPYDGYRVTVKAGEKLRLVMASNAFDAVVSVGREDDGMFSVVASDDDGLSDTHARLDWTPDEDGTYLVRAGAFARGQEGEYVLRLERQP